MIKALDEQEKRAYKAALEALEEWMPLVRRPLELETMKDAVRLFQEGVETGYVSYELDELEHLINLVMKLKKRARVLRQPAMSPELHGQKVNSIPIREQLSRR